jgi:hypothetical protein
MTLPQDSASRDTEATLALLYKAIARMPENVDAMIGLAGTHLQAGQLREASDWCARALALEQSERVMRMQAAIVETLIKHALDEVVKGRMDRALDTLARTPGAHAPLYRELLLTAAAWFDAARGMAPEPDTVRLSLPVWGADYISATASGLLRTLLAPGNLPALGRKRKVRLEITTTARDRAALEAEPVLAALGQSAAIDYFILPDAVVAATAPRDFSYWVMSAGHHASMARACHARSAISFLTADMLLSDGSLEAAQRLLEDGFEAVLVRALEAERGALAPEGPRPADPLSLSGRDLVDHGLARLGLDRADAIPDGCRALTPCTFAVSGGYAAYGFHFLPLLISAELARRPFVRDLLTVDTRIVRLALGDRGPGGRVKVVADPAEIAVASTLTTARGNVETTVPDANTLGRWGASWCFEPADAAYFDWCLGHRVVFPFSGATVDPQPGARERAAIGDVISAFRHHAARRLAERTARG